MNYNELKPGMLLGFKYDSQTYRITYIEKITSEYVKIIKIDAMDRKRRFNIEFDSIKSYDWDDDDFVFSRYTEYDYNSIHILITTIFEYDIQIY